MKEVLKMLTKLIMFLIHLQYRKTRERGYGIHYIEGTGKDFPKYLIYTEDETCAKLMKEVVDSLEDELKY